MREMSSAESGPGAGDWVVLGGICSVAVGTIIAVNTH